MFCITISMSTPKVLYQTWKTHDIPERFWANQKKWLETCPPEQGWQYKLLDDNDLRDLVKQHFPQYLQAYDDFTNPIERVDFARNIMMYLGGVYADLDTYPTKPIDRFVELNKVVLGTEPIEHAREIYGRQRVLCNAFMISPTGDKLWPKLMDYIVQNYEAYYKPVENTGPMAMTRFYEARPELFTNVVIEPPCTFFPLTGKGKVTEGCDMDRETYVVHVWSNTWVSRPWNDPLWFNRRYWFWALMTIFVVMWVGLWWRG
jgi:hypothetical protein